MVIKTAPQAALKGQCNKSGRLKGAGKMLTKKMPRVINYSASNTNESIAKFRETSPLREAEKSEVWGSRDNRINALQDGVAIAAKVFAGGGGSSEGGQKKRRKWARRRRR
jgi:hypothetical protein